MPELEIHHEGGPETDPAGQKVGVLAALLAVALAITSIASHRAHTKAVVLKAAENDQWSYHQSKRIKYHSLELGEDLISLLAAKNAESQSILDKYRTEKARYAREAKEIQDEAEKKEKEMEHTEGRALFYDFGEGLLEIGLVLTSLYFISRKKLFPVIGVIAGVVGGALAAAGSFL